MPRLFVALDFPNTIKDQLGELCDLALWGANWVDFDQFHLTLRFIGEINESRAAVVSQSLGQIRESMMELVLKGVGFFPPRGHPNLLWAGVEKQEILMRLQQKIERQLIQAGLPPEGRKFMPHVTLARLKGASDREIGHYLVQNNLFKTPAFPIYGFTLYSSRLTPSGPIYRREQVYRLVGAPEFFPEALEEANEDWEENEETDESFLK